ncbi:uncharacterized protein LOC144128008 [Amblyomma americanum]
MPDQRLRVLHRFLGHVTGVNWRPTRFAEDVPTSRVCGLCQMIPKKTVQLPCPHFLCESCHASSAGGGGEICPLDRDAFDHDECTWNPFPNRKAHALKAHCWNDTHGCEFVGTMDVVLRHYETECTFHVVECPQCGVGVLHGDLAAHFAAGCCSGTPLAQTEQSSSQDNSLTIQDVGATVEELRALRIDPCYDQLLSLQSQINQLMEQSERDAARLQETVRLLTESADTIKHQASLIAGHMSSMVAQVHQSRGGAEKSRDGVNESAALTSPQSWLTEKMLILRKLEMLAKSSLSALQQTGQSVESFIDPVTIVRNKCIRLVTFAGVEAAEPEPLSSKEGLVAREYQFQLKNIGEALKVTSADYRRWADIVIWHRRDTYLEIVVETNFEVLALNIRCFGLLESSHLMSTRCGVEVLNNDPAKNRAMRKFPQVFSLD